MNERFDASVESPPLGRWVLPALLVLNVCVFLWAHGPALNQPLVCNDDVRQQIYWMQQWRDASLYPNDLLTDYASAYVPWGVKALYWFAARWVDPLAFSKWLPGFLFVVLGVMLFLIGRRLAGRAAGWCVVGTYWLMPFFLDRLAGGLARSFAAPLLALFVLGCLAQRPSVVGMALILQALFIPYLTPVCVGAVLLFFILPRRWRQGAWCRPLTWGHAIWPVAASATALAWSHTLSDAGYGPWAGVRELTSESVFSQAGRYAVWPPASLLYELTAAPWQRIGPFQEMGLFAGALITVLLLVGFAWAARYVDWRALAPVCPMACSLAAASFAVFFTARLFALRLFIPNRYVIYPVNIAYVVLLGLLVHGAWRAWSPRRREMGVALVMLAAVLGAARLRGVGLYDFSADKPVIAAVRTLPKDTLIAGPPALMDSVLTFGRRKVLVSYELSHPWLTGYWQTIESRLSDLFAAYYSDDPAAIRAFCERYDVDWLVVDERDFTINPDGRREKHTRSKAPDFLRGRPFFAPFDEEINARIAGQSAFALLSPSNFPCIRLDADRRLLDMRHPGPPIIGETAGAL